MHFFVDVLSFNLFHLLLRQYVTLFNYNMVMALVDFLSCWFAIDNFEINATSYIRIFIYIYLSFDCSTNIVSKIHSQSILSLDFSSLSNNILVFLLIRTERECIPTNKIFFVSFCAFKFNFYGLIQTSIKSTQKNFNWKNRIESNDWSLRVIDISLIG